MASSIDVITVSFGENISVFNIAPQNSNPLLSSLSLSTFVVPGSMSIPCSASPNNLSSPISHLSSTENDNSDKIHLNPKRISWKRKAREKGKNSSRLLTQAKEGVGGKRGPGALLDCMETDELEPVSKKNKFNSVSSIVTDFTSAVGAPELHRREQ